MARIEGTVVSFNNISGCGFIKPDSGGRNVFVRQSEIKRGGYTDLREGDRVEFEMAQDTKGPKATGVVRVIMD